MADYQKVIGRRNLNFKSKKDGEQHTACILGVAQKNNTPGSFGVQVTEYFIDSKSEAVYNVAMSLSQDDLIIPLERIVNNSKFLTDIVVKDKK